MTDDEFDAFVDNLQDKVFTEAKDAYGEKGFDRWRNPKHCGQMDCAEGYGRITGDCGDTIEMFIKVDNDTIADAMYMTTGCGSSSLCGSFAAELAIGRDVESVFELRGEDVLASIGKFPDAEKHCAFLAVNTLHEAVNSYLVKRTQENPKG